MIKSIIQFWELNELIIQSQPGASEKLIEQAESELNVVFPEELKNLYRYADGISLLPDGSLNFYSLFPDNEKMGVTHASNKLREWGWVIPEEVIVFGDNGGDEQYGIWIPKGKVPSRTYPVIEIGENFSPKNMAIVGTSFDIFLKTITFLRIGLIDNLTDKKLLDQFVLPSTSKDLFKQDEIFVNQVYKQMDPKLPDYDPDPYARPLDQHDVRAWLSTLNKQKIGIHSRY